MTYAWSILGILNSLPSLFFCVDIATCQIWEVILLCRVADHVHSNKSAFQEPLVLESGVEVTKMSSLDEAKSVDSRICLLICSGIKKKNFLRLLGPENGRHKPVWNRLLSAHGAHVLPLNHWWQNSQRQVNNVNGVADLRILARDLCSCCYLRIWIFNLYYVLHVSPLNKWKSVIMAFGS